MLIKTLLGVNVITHGSELAKTELPDVTSF